MTYAFDWSLIRLMNFVAVLTRQIRILRRGIRILIGLTGFSVLLGLTLIALSFVRSNGEGPNWLTLGAGILANALAGVPIIQILTRMERIETYGEIIVCFEDCKDEHPECREQCVRFAEVVIEDTSKR